MKKFYDLIISEDIRKYCEETGYELDTMQCIKLVYDSITISLEERHHLYEEIMKTMPEPELTENQKAEYEKTAYEMLKEHIKLEKQAAEAFLKDADEPLYRDHESPKEPQPLKEVLADMGDYCKQYNISVKDAPSGIKNTKCEGMCWLWADGTINFIEFVSSSIFECFLFGSTVRSLPVTFESGDYSM